MLHVYALRAGIAVSVLLLLIVIVLASVQAG
ncbi:hypothetical protein J2T57_000515 [Natronocella acetinitrilica]|uniref:Uncharacterized protein n=1 Tax=Natronocella acetinitrilica TaxID=414046 RepID=A0AAE3G2V4_9GAMM|nr:hypothetical protein [Natronocella acetinitrilica]